MCVAMFKLTASILLTVNVLCSGYRPELDKTFYTATTNRFDPNENRGAEPELKFRLTNRLNEVNNRQALQNILGTNNNEGHANILEDLIKNSNKKYKPEDLFRKADEVVFTNTFLDEDANNDRNVKLAPNEEQIERVAERTADTEDNKETSNREGRSFRETLDSYDALDYDADIESRFQAPIAPNTKEDLGPITKRRMAEPASNSREMDPSEDERHPISEPNSRAQSRDANIPRYRTSLPYLGPAFYTASPILEQVANLDRQPNLEAPMFRRSGSGAPKLIDDYKDDGSNNYAYASTRMQQESKVNLLARLAEVTVPSFGTVKPNIYPGYLSPSQRYFPDNYRRLVRIL